MRELRLRTRGWLGRTWDDVPHHPSSREKCPARERCWPDGGCPAARILYMQQEQEQAGMDSSCKIASVEGGRGGHRMQ